MGAVSARYDGHADWYDDTFRDFANLQNWAGLIQRLLGPARTRGDHCLDVGCGTGLHFAAIETLGYSPFGIDVSFDQLRIARTRNQCLALADGAKLPLPDNSLPAVFSAFTHTDVDDFPSFIGEAARVLAPGGRLVYVGLHPCYVGTFIDRHQETSGRSLEFIAGYGDEELRYDHTGRFALTSRVGRRSLTLTSFLSAFISQRQLRIVSFEELDTQANLWEPDAADGRVVPWNVALTAMKIGWVIQANM
jgi:ubiquinone/menaquinone biosynthesis C-methylase UbiE